MKIGFALIFFLNVLCFIFTSAGLGSNEHPRRCPSHPPNSEFKRGFLLPSSGRLWSPCPAGIHGEESRRQVPSPEGEGERKMPPAGVPALSAPLPTPDRKTRVAWAVGKLGGIAGTGKGRQCGNHSCFVVLCCGCKEGGRCGLRAPLTLLHPYGHAMRMESPLWSHIPIHCVTQLCCWQALHSWVCICCPSWWEGERLGRLLAERMLSWSVSFPRTPNPATLAPSPGHGYSYLWLCGVLERRGGWCCLPTLSHFPSSLTL